MKLPPNYDTQTQTRPVILTVITRGIVDGNMQQGPHAGPEDASISTCRGNFILLSYQPP